MRTDIEIVQTLAEFDELYQEGDNIMFTSYGFQRLRGKENAFPEIITLPMYLLDWAEIRRLYLKIQKKGMLPEDEVLTAIAGFQLPQKWFQLTAKQHAEVLSYIIESHKNK